jgi:hypothetical protein
MSARPSVASESTSTEPIQMRSRRVRAAMAMEPKTNRATATISAAIIPDHGAHETQRQQEQPGLLCDPSGQVYAWCDPPL